MVPQPVGAIGTHIRTPGSSTKKLSVDDPRMNYPKPQRQNMNRPIAGEPQYGEGYSGYNMNQYNADKPIERWNPTIEVEHDRSRRGRYCCCFRHRRGANLCCFCFLIFLIALGVGLFYVFPRIPVCFLLTNFDTGNQGFRTNH